MSERNKAGYTAFPAPGLQKGDPLSGLTERQYYKAAALQSLSGGMMTNLIAKAELSDPVPFLPIAQLCGHIADAMLAEDEEHAKK